MTTLAVASKKDARRTADSQDNRSSKSRVQLDLPPKSMERLNALKIKTEATSYAEVIKNALRLYEALIDDIEKGREILLRDEDGNVSPYRIFL